MLTLWRRKCSAETIETEEKVESGRLALFCLGNERPDYNCLQTILVKSSISFYHGGVVCQSSRSVFNSSVYDSGKDRDKISNQPVSGPKII